jgi:tetratricopeptide (TPR) repeat protein
VRAIRAEEKATKEARRAAHAEVIARTEARRASLAEKTARTEATNSQQVAQFFTDTLKAVEPSVALGRDTKLLRDILDKTVERIGKELKDQPELEARLRSTVGQVFTDLGQYEKGASMFSEALGLRRKLFGHEHLDVAQSLLDLSYVLRLQNRLSEAEDMCRKALAMRRKLLGSQHPDVATSLNRLADVLGAQNKLTEAEDMHRQALVMRRRLLHAEDPDVAYSLMGLADVLWKVGKQAKAETLYREALAMRRKLFGDVQEGHPAVAASLNGVAKVLSSKGNLLEAEAMYREALGIRRRLFANNAHPDVARSLGHMGDVLAAQGSGKLAEAEEYYREALAMRRKIFLGGNEQSDVAASLSSLVTVLQRQGKLAEAEQLLSEFLTPAVESEPRSAGLLRLRGNVRARTARWKEAAADLSKAVQLDPAQHGSWFQLAPLLIVNGDLAGYRQHRHAMLARFGAAAEPRTMGIVPRVAGFQPARPV